MPKRKGHAGGYCDLAGSEVQLEAQTQRERLATCLRLGYSVVALGHRAALQAVVQLGKPLGTLQQLSRLTVVAEDGAAAQAACSFAAVTSTYDLLAVRPENEKTLLLACTTLPVDIISLDLTKRLPFRFKPSAVAAALARGVHFEVSYSGLLRDDASRRQLFANASALARETRGRGLVLSSGARTVMDLRRPVDVANLGSLLGLTPQQAQQALITAPQEVLRHARARKAYKGVLSLRHVTLRDIAELTPGAEPVEQATSGANGVVGDELPKKTTKRTFAQLQGAAA